MAAASVVPDTCSSGGIRIVPSGQLWGRKLESGEQDIGHVSEQRRQSHLQACLEGDHTQVPPPSQNILGSLVFLNK